MRPSLVNDTAPLAANVDLIVVIGRGFARAEPFPGLWERALRENRASAPT